MIPSIAIRINIPQEYLEGRKIIGKECTFEETLVITKTRYASLDFGTSIVYV